MHRFFHNILYKTSKPWRRRVSRKITFFMSSNSNENRNLL